MKVYFDNAENVLSRLGIKNKYYNNAAILLFSPDTSKIFPQAVIKIGKFRKSRKILIVTAANALEKEPEEVEIWDVERVLKEVKSL